MATATAATLKDGATTAKTDLSEPLPNPSTANKAEQPPPSTTATVLSSKDGDAKESEAGKDIGAEKKDGPVTDIQKKIRRAERFGMPVQLSEEEKRNSRAERFGVGPAVHGSDALKKSEEQKRKARADRFGIVKPAPSDDEAKKKARLDRFGLVPKADAQEEEKKKARALRFSQPTSGSLPQANGKGTDVETKAIGGNTGGDT